MKKRVVIIALLVLASSKTFARGFGDSFGGSFLGGFTGSVVGNAVSQPRRSECHYYQQPQQRVVEVQRPTYIHVEKPRKKHSQSARIDQRMQELETKSREIEFQQLKADLAKVQAENEQLKLQLQKYDMQKVR